MEAVRAVFEAGSITAAAGLLGVTQPAMSRLLRQAETEIGLPLFQRLGNRLQPTAEVRSLLPHLARALDEVEGVREAVAALRAEGGEACTVATTPALGFALLHPAIALLRRSGDVRVAVRPMLNHQVVEEVHAGRAAFGLILAAADAMPGGPDVLLRSRAVCIMPARHGLARRRAIPMAALAGEPLVCFSRTLPLGRLVHDLAERVGVRLRVVVEAGSSAAACDLVRRGVGLAIIEELTLAGVEGTGLVGRPLAPAAWLSARVVLPDRRPPARAAAHLLDAIRRLAAAT